METATAPAQTTASDRIKLDLTFDVAKLQAETDNISLNTFIYYDVLPLRAPAHLVDATLPEPPPSEDHADGSWTDWLNTSHLEKSPYLKSVVEFFQQHTSVTLVRLLRLAPGAIVKEHCDPTLAVEVPKSVVRLTVPIYTNDEVTFYLNSKPVQMGLGECWYLRLCDPHKITNFSQEARINLTIDMIPNEWVRELIATGQPA